MVSLERTSVRRDTESKNTKSFGNSSRSIRNSQMQQQQRLQKRNPRVQSENNHGRHRSRHDTSTKKSTQTSLRWIVENSEQLVKNQRNKGQPVTPEGNLMRNQLLASLRKLSLADTKLDVTRAGEEISEVLGIHYKQPTSVFSFNTTVTANATTSDCITTTTDSTSTCNALQKLQNTPLLERVINACSLAGLVDLSIEILYTVLKTDDESGIHGMTKLSPGGICYISILQSLRKMKRLPKMKEVLLRMGMHSINNTDSASFLDNPNVDCEDGYVNIVAFNVYLAALCDNQSQLKTDSSSSNKRNRRNTDSGIITNTDYYKNLQLAILLLRNSEETRNLYGLPPLQDRYIMLPPSWFKDGDMHLPCAVILLCRALIVDPC
mmetsp:Transcript_13240/g.16155  ORF Transcript_13240/g.16155 Transcript_13240/m.16155 type:complete len:379 (-) Transcript_13240:38-1174(-)